MSSSVSQIVRRWALSLSLALVLLAYALVGAQASSASVETYVNEAVPEAGGIPIDRPLPSDVNQPLPAGSLRLTRPAQEAERAAKEKAARRPKLPVGSVAAPQISPAPPSLQSTATASSANMMLMRGLRLSLQKAGQNPDLPKSDLKPQAPVASATSSPEALLPTEKVSGAAGKGVQYEPGQEPKSLDGGALASSEEGTEESSQETSIFGAPVHEEEVVENRSAQSAPVAAPKTSKRPVKASSGKCEPAVTPWTKSCEDAGYPSGYVGSLTGETRVSCPSGDVQDVWLTNSCEMSSSRSADRVPSYSDEVAVAASCGSANGLAVAAVPTTDLCAVGEESSVTGEGPWLWTCKGANGGMVVSCAAPKSAEKTIVTPTKSEAKTDAERVHVSAMEDGQCGQSDGVGGDAAPVDGLCAKGIASSVSGDGPWTWACSGINGGQAQACSAPKRVDGICGSANETATTEMPRKDLCLAGYASAVNGDGPWTWTCAGLHGGVAATCSATSPVNAICGAASLKGHHKAPTGDLCTTGEAGTVDGSGPWTWDCSGANGGATVTCSAAVSVDGACGSANGVGAEKTPSDDLCSIGRATRVTGTGPWNWNCLGTEGGNTTSCAAPVAQVSGPAAVGATKSAASSEAPAVSSAETAKNFAASSTTEAVSPEAAIENTMAAIGDEAAAKPFVPSKAVPSSSASPRMASVAAEVKCGSAADKPVTSAPRSDLCEAGKATTVSGSGPWTWSCVKDVKKGKAVDGPRATCTAPLKSDGLCGSASGSIQKTIPVTNLCTSGEATPVSGNGPWIWSCVGTGGGNSVSCSANSQSLMRVDGVCGLAASAPMATAPVTQLCDSGAPSAVNGEGPWTWTCSGANGGIASVCTTNKVVPRAPAPPAAAVDAVCGAANGAAALEKPMLELCGAGTATEISGNGPWNWNCLGVNGGMSVSCTAPLMPPAPIDGICGPANGVMTASAPRGGLCAGGIASSVSGKGPWTWSCSGVNGGGAVSCVAPMLGKGGALPSTVVPSPEDEGEALPQAPAPKAKGLVTPRLSSSDAPTPLIKAKATKSAKASPSAPSALSLPEKPVVIEGDWKQPPALPEAAPELPAGTEALVPPVRDNGSSSQALPEASAATTALSVPNMRIGLDPKASVIKFDQGSDILNKRAKETADLLASGLQARPTIRITLVSGADGSGMSPRDARRLSLNRVLVLRDYLVSKGVAANRIDVRALGVNIQGDDMDRIDIKVN